MTLLALSGVVGVTFTGKKHYVTDHLSDCTIWQFACVLLWIIETNLGRVHIAIFRNSDPT